MISFSRLIKPLLLAGLGVAAVGATAQDAPKSASAKKGNWSEVVIENEGGHRIGNPQADGQLVEFMSYTCSHCADFARQGEGAIKLLYVPTGKVSYEIRHLIRDPIDLTVALAAHCGDADDFPANHEALILKYGEWMAKARKATQAQQSRWRFGSFGSRAQAIASDLDFYDIMQARGYSRTQLDRCLTDEAKARAIAEQSQSDIQRYGLRGTPTFMMDGKKLEAHNWETLQPVLDRFFR